MVTCGTGGFGMDHRNRGSKVSKDISLGFNSVLDIGRLSPAREEKASVDYLINE